MEEAYRCGPIARFSLGSGYELVRFPLAGFNKRLPSAVADALVGWTSFQTLSDAASVITRAIQSFPFAECLSLFEDLKSRGGLVAKSSLLSAKGRRDASAKDEQIPFLAIGSWDSTECLQSSIETYAENILEFGHKCTILLANDQSERASQLACERMLESRFSRSAVPIAYLGPDQELAFLGEMRRICTAPQRVLEFLVLGRPFNRETGASGNALLLSTVGSRLLRVRAGTACTAYRLSELGTPKAASLELAGHSPAEELWTFPDKDAALAYVQAEEVDLLREHGQFLGQRLDKIVSNGSTAYSSSSFTLCDHLLMSAVSNVPIVRATCTGAMEILNATTEEAIAPRYSRETFTDDRLPKRSSYAVRHVFCTSISHVPSSARSPVCGLDNKISLPPFMPNCGPNEDKVFATLLTLDDDDSCVAHLPFALWTVEIEHPEKSFSEDIHMGDVILQIVRAWSPAPTSGQLSERLQALGHHMCALSSLNTEDFEEYVTFVMCCWMSRRIVAMEKLLGRQSFSPRSWAMRIEQRITTLRQISRNLTTALQVVLDGVGCAMSLKEYCDLCGQALVCWPDIRRAAASLRTESNEPFGARLFGARNGLH